MKKSLLTLMLAVLTMGTAMAFGLQHAPLTVKGDATAAPFKIEKSTSVGGPQRAATAQGFDLYFCDGLYSWYSFTRANNVTYKCYIYITPEIATALAGNQLVDVTFSMASDFTDTREGSIFVAEDEAGIVTETPVTVVNSYANYQNGGSPVQTAAFDAPYTIKEGTGFYFGFIIKGVKYTDSGDDYPVAVDGSPANDFAGYIDIFDASNQYVGSVDMADAGTNLFISGTTIGDKHDVENIFNVTGAYLGYRLPVYKDLANNNIYVQISNIGTNDLTTINYTITLDNGESTTADAAINIPGSSLSMCALPLPTLTPGRTALTLTVNSINGKECPIGGSFEYIGLGNDGYPRKFVVEEGTGTWCGWCPRGIVGFQYMETNHADDFIGIAVHSGDAMEAATYGAFIKEYFAGFPSGVVNRDPYYSIDPSAEELQEVYDLWQSQPGVASLSLNVTTPVDGVAEATVTTEFAIDDNNGKYALAFVVLENGIYATQTNYYAGGSNGACGGWETYRQSKLWNYKHVARGIYDTFGIAGSVPAQITAGEAYTFTYSVPFTSVKKVANTTVVALLLDTTTGTVLNAVKVPAAQYGEGGVNAIGADINANAPVEYYDLQGRRLDSNSLPAGVYITRQGQTVGKIVVK